ncbi:MAG TPA: hypothetical protein VKA34_10285 [Balneolales bacterium]|nr:hypothetical protein [Balneolales bacterium]
MQEKPNIIWYDRMNLTVQRSILPNGTLLLGMRANMERKVTEIGNWNTTPVDRKIYV